MTYDSRENSVHDGSPVELFTFNRVGVEWRYTSQGSDFDLSGTVYTAIPITRTPAEQTQAFERADVRITMPRDVDVAAQFIAIPPANVMQVRIQRTHRGETETALVFTGRVLNAEWDPAAVTFVCEPVSTSLRRAGLRRHYGRNCIHGLYDTGCRADPTLHRTNGQVDAINGSTISVGAAAGIPDGDLAGGYAAWTATGGAEEQRSILSNTGAAVELIAPPFGLEIGDTVQLHEGCKHTLADCDTRFANAENYGGFPFTPLRSPFDGSPIY